MTKSNDNGRNPDGTFAPGNGYGQGRPNRATEVRYLAMLSKVVTLDDWQAICEKARQQALEGDDKARRWIGEYLMGGRAQIPLANAHAIDITEGLGEDDKLFPDDVRDAMQNIVQMRAMSARLAGGS